MKIIFLLTRHSSSGTFCLPKEFIHKLLSSAQEHSG
jgi:hypothetical protein